MIDNTPFQWDAIKQLPDEQHSQIQEEPSLQENPTEIEKGVSENNQLTERVRNLCEFILKNGKNKKALNAAKACKEKNWKIEELYEIDELDISGRHLTEIPSELELLKNLYKLIANANKLSTLPKYLVDLPELRHLKLAGNKFTEVPSILIKPQVCEIKVFLANNPIRELAFAAKPILVHPLPYYTKWI